LCLQRERVHCTGERRFASPKNGAARVFSKPEQNALTVSLPLAPYCYKFIPIPARKQASIAMTKPSTSLTQDAHSPLDKQISRGFSRIVMLVVACPLFLQSLDTSVMATALPSMAHALGVRVLDLNVAITAYLLTLATFLPISGWLADRFGARRMFCASILLFSIGSGLCGIAASVPALIVYRLIQGTGGALMLPVARLILLRTVPPSQLVEAMVWFTIPSAIGRLTGPFFGGAIVSIASWHWIFLVNIPFGILSVALALRLIDRDDASVGTRRLDGLGFVMLSIGLTGVIGSLDAIGKGMLSWEAIAAGTTVGAAAMIAYFVHSRHATNPLIDLSIFRVAGYRASTLGGMPMRIGIGAAPFLLPLMLQLGFGFSPVKSGSLTMATALGSLITRTLIRRTIKAAGFRNMLIGAAALTSLFYAAYALLTPSTPWPLIVAILTLGGLFNSMALVSVNAFGFSEIPRDRMSHASTASIMIQQLSVCFGVVLGAALLELMTSLRGVDAAHLQAGDFAPAFVVVAAVTLLSVGWFIKLPANAGEESNASS
jgi:EmrB/QacA subfamily drug resistance transporter